MVEKYGSWTVKQLKNELFNRSAKVSGKKTELIERLAAYDRNNNFEVSWTVEERSSLIEVSRVQWPPDSTFSSIQVTSTVPPIDIVHINNYFLNVYKFEAGMSTYAAVHRKGFNMMQNYFLLAMMETKNEDNYYYRAQVNSEMTKQLTYFVKLAIMLDGSILEASCECIAGKGIKAVCKHVSVVCYALLHLREQGKLCLRNTCTEKEQTWHMPKKVRLELSPKKAQNINYTVPEYNVRKKQMGNLCYDPRPECYKNMPSYNDNVRNLVINYSSAEKRSLAISGSFTTASIQGISNDHDYLSNSFIHQMVFNRIQVSKEEAETIEKKTRSQSRSKMWFKERSVRITASIVGTIVHMTDKKNVDALVESIINPKQLQSPSIEWGKLNESNATRAYEEATTNHVAPCGLFVSINHPYVAASPDGLVRSLTVLEVKCPYAIKDSLISADSLSYLEEKNNNLVLKTNSNYYYQVQTQMYVTGREFCDFVIWTSHDYKCISVNRNDNVIHNEILPKLKRFYDKFMVPALAKKYYIL